ncbi:hypothetical protein [Microbispora hainanensis]|uniref:PqqD family protein n=1 Tax=Microbispora hainanensis TaxID=568844 RepID=A0A544YGK9_9ACTN|nr:hypothetical protein [Microbispora hainanensis]TQS15642.1 hypothetical protein FLX08_32555 [Microbispora hainanensis]
MTPTRVILHDLGVRRDREEWIVGRVETGDVIAVPAQGMRVIRLFQEGATVPEVERRLGAETGIRMNVGGFVDGLVRAGLVAAVDGRPVPAPAPPPPTFPRLLPRHVRWTLDPVLHAALAAVILAGAAVALLRPGVMPGWRDLLWSDRGTLVLLAQTAAGWLLILLHELAHLCTARAAGVPGRIRFGTRLQFLTAQTEVSGIWLAERRVRLTVYLAGMAVDAAVCAVCLLLTVAAGPRPALSVVALTALVMLSAQFLVFMRTDLYFVLQDVTGCRNLYGDSVAYSAHVCRRALLRRSADPLARLPRAEGRWVRAYTALLVAGTALCLWLAAVVTIPATLGLLAGAVRALLDPPGWVAAADGVVTVLVVTGFHVLWATTWWRRHGPKARRAAGLLRRNRDPERCVR